MRDNSRRRYFGPTAVSANESGGACGSADKPNDFHFDRVLDDNSYKLTWDVFDPGDFFEAHFLLATNLDEPALQKLIAVDGLFAGNVRVSAVSLTDIRGFRNLTNAVVALVVFVPLLFMLTMIEKSEIDQGVVKKLMAVGSWPSALLGTVGMLLIIAIAIAIAIPVASYFFYVPSWLEPPYSLPFLRH